MGRHNQSAASIATVALHKAGGMRPTTRKTPETFIHIYHATVNKSRLTDKAQMVFDLVAVGVDYATYLGKCTECGEAGIAFQTPYDTDNVAILPPDNGVETICPKCEDVLDHVEADDVRRTRETMERLEHLEALRQRSIRRAQDKEQKRLDDLKASGALYAKGSVSDRWSA